MCAFFETKFVSKWMRVCIDKRVTLDSFYFFTSIKYEQFLEKFIPVRRITI